MKKYILLADDSRDDELYFKQILNAVGVENPVRVVRDGTEAICYLKGEGVYADRQLYPLPSVVFLDLVMPRADGWEVLRWLYANSERNQLLVIVLTGVGQTRQLQNAYELGADSFLFKPFKLEELKGLIEYWPEFWMLPGQNLPPSTARP